MARKRAWANSAPVSWRRDPEALLARVEAFEQGLG